MEVASPISFAVCQFDPRDAIESFWAEIFGAKSDASTDIASPPPLLAAVADCSSKALESCSGSDAIVAKGPSCISPSSNEAASDVKAPVIIDASCPTSSALLMGKMSLDSSDELANELSSLHIQGSRSPPHNAKTNTPMTSSSVPPQYFPHRRHRPYQARRERQNRDGNVSGLNGGNIYMPPRFPGPLPRPPLPTPPYPFSQCFPPLAPPPYGGPYARPGFGPCFPFYGPPPPPPPSPVPYRLPILPNGNFSAIPISELRLMIVRQIEYYFSFENLIKDIYLRKQMDQQGWVPVRLIATFRKIREMTDDIQIILDSLRTSTIFEILDDKIRLHVDWERWVIPEGYLLP